MGAQQTNSVTIDELDRGLVLLKSRATMRDEWQAWAGKWLALTIEQAKSERLLRRDFEALQTQFEELRQIRQQ